MVAQTYEMIAPFITKLWRVMTPEDERCVKGMPEQVSPERDSVFGLKRCIIKILIFFVSVSISCATR